MKKLLVLLTVNLLPWASYGQVTVSPRVEFQNDLQVKITKVELTPDYTKVYMRFTQDAYTGNTPRSRPEDRFGMRRPPGGTSSIWIDPNTRLYKPGDINKKFKFLRAEGIPTGPERRPVSPNEVVEFVTYFERLSPGIEEFDYFEGRSGPGGQTWNFEGIRINNPLNPKKGPVTAQPKPDKKDPVLEPELNLGKEETREITTPAGLIAIKGSVLNEKSGLLIPAQITYTDSGDTMQINSSSGRYQIGLDAGKSYTIRVSAKGFISSEFLLDPSTNTDSLDDRTKGNLILKDFLLRPISAGESFTLHNIYFATGAFDLLSESFGELDNLLLMMKENPKMQISVEGHTDNLGDFDKNVKLSQDRANSVRDYLVKKGIKRERIEVRGYGPAKPISNGTSDEERQKNRRVEIVISKN